MAPVTSAGSPEAATLTLALPGDQGEPGDDALVQQLIAGSEDALGRLYDRHMPAVLAVAARVGLDRAAAEDVVQETFLALWNRAERFDPARGSLRTWLLTIARNRAVDHVRTNHVRNRATPFSAFGTGERDEELGSAWLGVFAAPLAMAMAEPGPDTAVLRSEERATLAAAMASLAPDERQVLELAYGGDLSQTEVATRLGWPLGTVKTRTRRALRRLREVLQARPQPSDRRPAVACCGSAGGMGPTI